jgi:hypothetical protein
MGGFVKDVYISPSLVTYKKCSYSFFLFLVPLKGCFHEEDEVNVASGAHALWSRRVRWFGSLIARPSVIEASVGKEGRVMMK